MATFAPVGSSQVSGSVSLTGATSPVIANVSMTLAATEYSYTFPANTKQFRIKLRGVASLQFAYVAADSGLQFITVPPGCHVGADLIALASGTIYFQANSPGQIAEIESWF